MDGPIYLGVLNSFNHIIIFPRSSELLGHWQVWYITVDSHNHIDLILPHDYCWGASGIVEDTYYIIVGFICGLGLVWGKISEEDQHGGIHCHVIVYKRVHIFSHNGGAFQYYGRRVVLKICVLCGCSVCGSIPSVGCVLGTQKGSVLELLEVCLDIFGHGNVHGSICIFPIKV